MPCLEETVNINDMKRRIIIVVLGVLMVSACGRKAVPERNEDAVAEAVNSIYGHVMACYAEDKDSSETFDQRYLTEDYRHVIDSVKAFDMQDSTGGVGFWDYDHWIMAQDWGKPTFTLDTVMDSGDGEKYWAKVTIHNLGVETEVFLLMMKEEGEWKIGEMLNYDWLLPSEIDMMYWYMRGE
jgi:hypothetical protein